MSEKLYYVPNLCKQCDKLNPENILVVDGTYRAAYSDYYTISSKLPYIKTEKGGITQYPRKLFIRNGYYK
ncbi:putative thioredoxin [Mythimna separata entomopoxvirus 'L']|uniref:Thioredoxin n=1 Tax=Mythimna separata entomopoxvirus 'L' TaxID=1293572 RepID=A0A916KQ59_9POXV|nr:putative thioredoxin [Mythimna separata entomopoxvirus 'L']CCU56300.1 putative thioredoxin [Mythimna separata entomopoxvirus 'L']